MTILQKNNNYFILYFHRHFLFDVTVNRLVDVIINCFSIVYILGDCFGFFTSLPVPMFGGFFFLFRKRTVYNFEVYYCIAICDGFFCVVIFVV